MDVRECKETYRKPDSSHCSTCYAAEMKNETCVDSRVVGGSDFEEGD